MKKLLSGCLGFTCLVGAGVAVYLLYKGREHGELEKIAPGVYQYSLYKSGKKYMGIGCSEEEAIEKAKKEFDLDDKRWFSKDL